MIAFPQATTQLDPGLAGNSGYGDIIPINENLYEGLTRYKNGTAEIEPRSPKAGRSQPTA